MDEVSDPDPSEELRAEMSRVVRDLSWLDRCTCCEGREVGEFFVSAGQTISPDLLDAARRCPARRDEVLYAYARGIPAGYVGGLSPGQRKALTLPEALAAIEAGEL